MVIPPNPKNKIIFDNLAHSTKSRRLIIVRHGERVDRCFQKEMPDWLHRMFPGKQNWESTGDEELLFSTSMDNYCRVNLNMPRRCPLRSTDEEHEFGIHDYKSDSPLTMVGESTAEKLGSRILKSNLKITKVYCSPALRCMQTCHRLLQGFCETTTGENNASVQLAINMEPALFDFTGFAESMLVIPTLLSPDDFMNEHQMSINKNYKPAITLDKLEAGEEVDQFYPRVQVAIDKILKDTEDEPQSSILIVTHAPVMDAISQLLPKLPLRQVSMFPKVANYPPYLATLVIEEIVAPKSALKWRLNPPPIKSFTHLRNSNFEWKKLCDEQ